MNLYARAHTAGDTDKITLRFYVLGRDPTNGYVLLGTSDSDFIFHELLSKKRLTMVIPNNISITAYDILMIVITAKATGDADGYLYFQSLNSYSHLHTTLL